MAQQVQFVYLAQSEYDTLESKSPGQLYFTSDTHRIYRGTELYATTSFDSVSAQTATFGDLTVTGNVSMSLSQVEFGRIEASEITVDGSSVSLEGHTHPELSGITESDISKTSATFQDLTVTGDVTFSVDQLDFQSLTASSLLVNGSQVALEGHTHSFADVDGLSTHVSQVTAAISTFNEQLQGITSSGIAKSTATFGDLTITGELTCSLDQVQFGSITASEISVNGSSVALEGHTHSIEDIEDYEDNTFWVTGSVDTQTLEIQVDQDFEDAVEAADAGKHIRAKLDYTGNGNYLCPWVNTIYNINGSAVAFDFHIMLDTNILTPDEDFHPYLISATWNSNGFYVRPYELAQIGEIPEGIWESGDETDSARRIISESIPVITGSESTVVSQGALTTGVANVAGLKGYRYTNTGSVTNSLTFETAPTGWAVGDVVSIVNADKYPDCSTIASISGTTVTFTENLPFSSVETDTGWDAKTAYVIAKPDVGDVDIGYGAYAEGLGTKAVNVAAHAEGRQTQALGQYAHAEGLNTTADGNKAHAEGWQTSAAGEDSHAEGGNTQTQNRYEHAQGSYNKSNKANTTFGNAGNTIHSIGIGTSESKRKNAVEVMQDGKVYIKDAGGYDGTNPTGSGVKDIATILSTVASSTHTHPELSGITQSSITKDTGTFTNLVVTGDVSLSLSQVQFGSIMASDISVNGSQVSLEGHVHAMSEIDGLESSISQLSASVSAFASAMSGLDATSISKSSATFGDLVVTGSVTFSVDQLDFDTLTASTILLNGSSVAVEGHLHSISDVSGLESVVTAYESRIAHLEGIVSALSTTYVTRSEFVELSESIESILDDIISGQAAAESQINQI